MKTRFLLRAAFGLLSVALPVSLRAQASAVDGMTALYSTATVNTSFIANKPYLYQTVPTRSTGTYKRVYSCSGNWDQGMTSQSGTMPEESTFWPDSEYYFETGKWYKVTTFEDGYFYIERYSETYNSTTGTASWSKVLYRGPATVAPTATSLALSATRLWAGQRLTTAASGSDADYDLWRFAVGFRNPNTGQTTYAKVDGWNYDSPSAAVNDTRLLTTPGRWRITLDVQDWAYKPATPTSAGDAWGVTDAGWVEVLPGAYYDPSGNVYTGSTAPVIAASGSSSVRLRAGQSGLSSVTFQVSGVGAGKPVRVSLGAAGGSTLFASSAGGGAGAAVLELVTNANGEVTVWISAGTRERLPTALYAVAGRGTAMVPVMITTAQDNDTDGMSDAMEEKLSGSATGVPYNPMSSAITGFRVF